jgi:hypothetical protein
MAVRTTQVNSGVVMYLPGKIRASQMVAQIIHRIQTQNNSVKNRPRRFVHY